MNRRGLAVAVLGVGPGGPGDSVREREEGRVTPRSVAGAS